MAGSEISKIMGATEWERMQADGSYAGSELDRRDGFIHMSMPGLQVRLQVPCGRTFGALCVDYVGDADATNSGALLCRQGRCNSSVHWCGAQRAMFSRVSSFVT